eukprot:COSAG04_NODE_5942_length_1450_cov_1.128053_1_plen_88_part_10
MQKHWLKICVQFPRFQLYPAGGGQAGHSDAETLLGLFASWRHTMAICQDSETPAATFAIGRNEWQGTGASKGSFGMKIVEVRASHTFR